MKQNIALLAIISLALTAYARQPVISTPLVTHVENSNSQVQPAPSQATEPYLVVYNYEQHTWPQSSPTHQWEGYVPAVYQPPASNAFDSMPAYSGGYSRPYWGGCAGGYCAPGLGLSVGFGIGGCSIGVGPCGISASAGLGCFPIGIGIGLGCY